MTYFDPHVWEDLSQQQKLKKESEQKNSPSIEKRDFLKFFCNKAVQVQQGRTNFPGPVHFYPSGPIHLSFHHFFFFNFFFFIIGLRERSRRSYDHRVLIQLPFEWTNPLVNWYIEAWRIHQSLLLLSIEYIYIYICMCVCVCVCVLLLLDCCFYLIKYGLEQFFW